MKRWLYCFTFLWLAAPLVEEDPQKVFDVHIHGSNDIVAQLRTLKQAGVYKAALSTSWNLQNKYPGKSKIHLLYGLVFPCPNGKMPYSLQPCYENGREWPTLDWVELQIKKGNIDFLGEVLNEYHGISPSDSSLFPYYALAEKYALPVGIHTGEAGLHHGCPNFNIEMGNPLLLEEILIRFPGLRIWIMHSGGHYYKETMGIMQQYKNVYADISVISNPEIVPSAQFKMAMEAFIEAGLEDRLMFGSDNGNIGKVIASVNQLDFLTGEQKNKIFYKNAERFFGDGKVGQ